MRIGVVSPQVASAPYRVLAPMSMLADQGHDVIWAGGLAAPQRERALQACDVVYYHKECSSSALREMRLLRRDGVAVVWDSDEDLGALARDPDTTLADRRTLGQRFEAGVSAAQLADLVTVATAPLAELYNREAGTPVRTIETVPTTQGWKPASRWHRRLTVGWIVGAEQARELPRLRIEAALTSFLDRHRHARVLTYGERLKVRSSRYEHYAMVPLHAVGTVLCDFDIGLAPLANTEFGASQSPVKVREYAAAGVPWLASSVGEHARLGAGEGGILVGEDDWEDALGVLARGRIQRLRLSRAGRRWASNETIEHAAGQWAGALSDAIERCSSSSCPPAGNGGCATGGGVAA